MIDVREKLAEEGDLLARLVTSFDFIWDIQNIPDFYCSNIKDFLDNSQIIRHGRPVLLPNVTYLPGDEANFTLRDVTGDLRAEMYIDNNLAEAMLQRTIGDPIRIKFNSLGCGDTMYDPIIEKSKRGKIYVLDFEVRGWASSDKPKSIGVRFPKLVPILAGNIK